jgi:hypothetical protein
MKLIQLFSLMTAVTALEKRADLFETARTSLTTSSTEGVDRTVADNSYYAATFGLIGVSAGAGGAAVSGWDNVKQKCYDTSRKDDNQPSRLDCFAAAAGCALYVIASAATATASVFTWMNARHNLRQANKRDGYFSIDTLLDGLLRNNTGIHSIEVLSDGTHVKRDDNIAPLSLLYQIHSNDGGLYPLEVTYNANTNVTSNWLPFNSNSTTIDKRDKSSYNRISLTGCGIKVDTCSQPASSDVKFESKLDEADWDTFYGISADMMRNGVWDAAGFDFEFFTEYDESWNNAISGRLTYEKGSYGSNYETCAEYNEVKKQNTFCVGKLYPATACKPFNPILIV